MAEQKVILVDENNRAAGSAGKTVAHRRGLLHRAFSIFLLDDRGRMVLQRRNPGKYHSGGLWANTCCGHPRPGERTMSAARRRLYEELGTASTLRLGFFARYQAKLDHAMHENEFVYVYFGRLNGALAPDPSEVADVALLSPAEIVARIKRQPAAFTFWLKHYFHSHGADIARLSAEV